MIIAAYAGCGKTTFVQRTWSSIDLVCVPYKYLMPETSPVEQAEAGKAEYGYPMNPAWPQNYISAVLTAYHRYRYIVIPTVPAVLEALRRFQLPYVLCYPARTARQEYRRRFRERGNGEAFESIFIGHWDDYLDLFEKDDYGKRLVLEEGEYLLDHRDMLDAYTDEKETVVQCDFYEELLQAANEILAETGVCLEEQVRQWIISLTEQPPEVLDAWKKEGHLVLPAEKVSLYEDK